MLLTTMIFMMITLAQKVGNFGVLCELLLKGKRYG
jgi:hypothetical protein